MATTIRSAPVIPVSEARKRLFHLVDDLLRGTTDRVVLSHRDRGANVVLLRAEDLERLERDLTTLRGRGAPAPTPLRGLGTLRGDAEDIISEIRAADRAMADAKLASAYAEPGARPVRRVAEKAPAHARKPRAR